MRISVRIMMFLVLAICVSSASAKNKHKNRDSQQEVSAPAAGQSQDQELVEAVENKRRVNFVEGEGLVVTKLLPDDNQGLRHQKWVVRLSSGKLLQAIYNLDMCPHVPLKEGDVVSMGGMFLWTNQGGILHWLHHDPRGNRPDGYVQVNGKFYCKE